MIEGGDGLRLALEPLAEIRANDLERDRAIQPRITRAVDVAHPAGADVFNDFVRTESNSGLQAHGVWRL